MKPYWNTGRQVTFLLVGTFVIFSKDIIMHALSKGKAIAVTGREGP
jgi:hypothetical protein